MVKRYQGLWLLADLVMAQAITAALYDRKNTGMGQHVEVSMLEASLYFIWPDRMLDQSFVDKPDSEGSDMTALYQAVPTQDGHITFMTLQLDEFHGLARSNLQGYQLIELERVRGSPVSWIQGQLVEILSMSLENWSLKVRKPIHLPFAILARPVNTALSPGMLPNPNWFPLRRPFVLSSVIVIIRWG